MMRNPIFESSMTRRMRSCRAPLLITLYVLFVLLVSAREIIVMQSREVTLGDLRVGLESYIYLSVMQFFLIILVAPALTAGAIAGERERQTLDLLLCTRVGAIRIVTGKLFSSVCFLALMVVSSLPVMAMTLFFGGVSLANMLVMVLFLIVTAIACSAVGIACSAVFKRTVTATVMAYLTIFALGVGSALLPILFQSDLLLQLNDALLRYTNGYATTASTIVSSSASTIVFSSTSGAASVGLETLQMIPKLFYLNPAIGLVSLLMHQTGLLQNTMSNFGYSGSAVFRLLRFMKPFAFINMGVLAALSLLMTFAAALFIRPEGLRAKKRK